MPHLIKVDTLDDGLLKLYPALLGLTEVLEGNRGKPFRELLGVQLRISRPRARLSRTETRGRAFSGLGELLWYMTGDNSLAFIRPYIRKYEQESDDGVTVYGGYGKRLRTMRGEHDQLENVLRLLKGRPTSKRAVVQLFDAQDIAANHTEVPCTTTIQFLVRGGCLHAFVNMRSNDAYMGLPHDVFCFTMLQEMVARYIGAELGEYIHSAASMHLYEDDRDGVEEYVSEAVQPRTEMAPMPPGNPWLAMRRVLDAEAAIRSGKAVAAADFVDGAYWQDLVRLLQVFWAKRGSPVIARLKAEMADPCFAPYIDTRKAGSGARVRAAGDGACGRQQAP